MSVLKFLRMITEGAELASSNASRPRPRRLALESLEGRAMLTGDDPLLADATNTFTEETASDDPVMTDSTTEDSTTTTTEESGSTSGTGGTDGGETSSEPVDDSSGSGTGEEEVQPTITSLESVRDGDWVALVGTATDDESLEGMTVYFSTNTGIQFTATIQADGSFATASYLLPPGTLVTGYLIDADGNYSETVSLIV